MISEDINALVLCYVVFTKYYSDVASYAVIFLMRFKIFDHCIYFYPNCPPMWLFGKSTEVSCTSCEVT